jgi:hypothetical protein
MEATKAIRSGLKNSISNKKLIFFLYLLNLLLAIIITLPFQNVIQNALGTSKSVEKLIDGFNFTVIFGFLNNFGSRLSILFTLIFWLGILFLIFNIFLTGGIISIWKTESKKFDKKAFFTDCSTYFFKFIKLLLLDIILILISLLFFLIVYFIISEITETLYSENTKAFLQITGFAIFLILFIIDIMIYDYAKIIIVKEVTEKSFYAIIESIKFVFKNLFVTSGIVLFLLIIFFILTYFYLQISHMIPDSTALLLILMFAIQQMYIIIRIGLRIISFAAQFNYYERKQSR